MILAIPLAFFVEWIDRKIFAKVQRRFGPLYTGPFGILQPVFDFLKLLGKETIRLHFKEERIISILVVAPVIILLFCFLFLPFPNIIISFKGDIIFIIFLYSLVVLFYILLGYLIPNPYSNIGSGRLLQMFISFELLFIISITSVIVFTNSIRISEIMDQKFPLAVILPLSLMGYILASSAKLGLTPFDIPEAHTEIAGGWKIELSGKDLAFVRFSFDLEYLFLSSLGALLYLGFGNFFEFLLKTILFVFVFSVIRATTARLRVDQALYLFWRGAIPLSLFQLILVVVVRVI